VPLHLANRNCYMMPGIETLEKLVKALNVLRYILFSGGIRD
jgi:hypothetical protein